MASIWYWICNRSFCNSGKITRVEKIGWVNSTKGSIYQHKWTEIWAWISNHVHHFPWDVITHPCIKLNVEIGAWTSIYIPLFCVDVIGPDAGFANLRQWKGHREAGKFTMRNELIFPQASSVVQKEQLSQTKFSRLWQHAAQRRLIRTIGQNHHDSCRCPGAKQAPGGLLSTKLPSYQYRDSHVKDKAVSPTVLSLT